MNFGLNFIGCGYGVRFIGFMKWGWFFLCFWVIIKILRFRGFVKYKYTGGC